MKKILVASSALVAVAFAGQAQASEKISLSVGGYMEQWIGFADQDNGNESVNAFQSDTEVHFSGSTTLDNGIEVGAKIELEGEGGNAGSMVDEQYLYVNGGFGQVKLGAEDGAAADMGISAPSVGPVGANDGDLPNWVALGGAVPDTVPAGADSKRLTYYTPSLGGFKAGVSYADDDSSENSDSVATGDSRVSAGVEYSGDFDGVSVAVAVVGEHKEEGEWYGVGTKVGFGAFTVGASVSETDGEFDAQKSASSTYADDTTDFDLGVSYAMDAASVSLTYAYGEYDNDAATAGVDELNTVDLGLAYTLGAGVTWKSSVFWFDLEGQDAGTADDNEGFGVVTGLALSF